MFENDFYEVARKRIDGRNRRWKLWSINLAGYLIYIGLFVMLASKDQSGVALMVLMIWTGVFVLHSIFAGMAETRSKDIEGEIARLRESGYDYEKPKRLELGDDGELIEIDEDEVEKPKRFVQ